MLPTRRVGEEHFTPRQMPQVKGSSQLILHFVPSDRETLQTRGQRTYPCQSACFQAAGSPSSSWRQFSLILVAIYLSPSPSSLSHTERWAESSTQPISHETPACPASGKDLQAEPLGSSNCHECGFTSFTTSNPRDNRAD